MRECAGATPTALVQIQGAADPFQNLDCSPLEDPPGGGSGDTLGSAYDTASFWVGHNGCEDTTELEGLETRSDGVGPEVELYRGRRCTYSADVDFYIIKDMGHRWPPYEGMSSPLLERLQGPHSAAIHATDTIWSFFAAHPRE